MSLNSRAPHPILSRPIRVHWAGWESDTHRLQQAGWEVSAYENIAACSMGVALRHRPSGAQGVSQLSRWDYFGYPHRDPYLEHLPFALQMGGTVVTSLGVADTYCGDPIRFHPVDCTPQFFERKQARLEDLAHFATPLVRTKEIILPEASVDDLLAQILEKQQEAKTTYFREQLYEEGRERPRERFHAQIISLAA